MSSRLTALMIILGVLVASCSLPTNESPAKKKPAQANVSFNSQCLRDSFPALKAFLQGRGAEGPVRASWECYSSALTEFRLKVTGSQANGYTREDLSNFFRRYFLDENSTLSDSFLLEIMKLKRILLGGSTELLTKQELAEALSLLQELEETSLVLLPYMKLYSMNWSGPVAKSYEQDKQFFIDADRALQEAAQRLGSRIEKTNASYSIADLAKFMAEVETFAGDRWDFIDQVKRAIPLVHKLKKSLVGGSETTIMSSEWRRFATLGSRGYTQFLRYHYFLKQPAPQASRSGLFTEAADDLLSYLSEMVRQKPGARFNKAEIIEIFDSLNALFPSLKVTPKLVDELMRLKQVFFGGRDEDFAPEEFDNARTKLGKLRGALSPVFDHWEFYTGSWTPSSSTAAELAYYNERDKALYEVMSQLGSMLESPYNLQNLAPLLGELSDLFLPENGQPTLEERYLKYLPLLITVKKIVMGDSDSVIQKAQWHDLFTLSGRGLMRFLYYHYFVSTQPQWTEGVGLEHVARLVHTTSDTLDLVLVRRNLIKKGPISFAELRALLDAMNSAKLLPSSFSASSIKPLLPMIFQRVLVAPQNRLSGRVPRGLSLEATRILKSEFSLWVDGQRFLQKIYSGSPSPLGYTGPRLIKLMQDSGSRSVALKEMSISLNSRVPLTLDSGGRWYMSAGNPIFYSKKAMHSLNLMRAVVRLVQNGYAGDLSRIRSYQGLTLGEANALFADVKDFAVREGLLEASNTTFVESRFREANLFTPHGNGDDLMSFAEGVDLATMIMSGLKLDSSMRALIKDQCRQYRGGRVSTRCFLYVYRQDMGRVLTAMAGMARYLRALPSTADLSGEYETMMINLLKATGWIDDGSGTVKFSDIALLPHIMQYVEATMLRFDTSRDGILNRAEAMAGYPVFEKILRKVAKTDVVKTLRGAFSYILVHGKVPETPAEKIHFITVWVNQESMWPIQADRRQLSKVLGYIADAMATAAQAQDSPEKPFNDLEPREFTGF